MFKFKICKTIITKTKNAKMVDIMDIAFLNLITNNN